MLPEVVGNGSQARQEQECDERRLAPDLDRDDRRQRQPDVTDWRRNVRQPKPARTKVDDAGRTDQEEDTVAAGQSHLARHHAMRKGRGQAATGGYAKAPMFGGMCWGSAALPCLSGAITSDLLAFSVACP